MKSTQASPTIALRDSLNQALLESCRTLPRAIQTRAVLFLIQDSGRPWPGGFDYFHRYFPASYSGLLWMNRHAPRPIAEDAAARVAATKALAAAMALHRIDDHLVDGEIHLSHMLLQLRTKLWAAYEDACGRLAGEDDKIFSAALDRYFAAIDANETTASPGAFRARFSDQAATWTLPLILSARAGGYSDEILKHARTMYETFAVAWRYVDDLNDWPQDAARGDPTGSVYLLLDSRGRSLWRTENPDESERLTALTRKLNDDDVLRRLFEQADDAISKARQDARDLGWPELAQDFEDVRSCWRSRHA